MRRRALELLEYLDLAYAADRLAGSLPFAVAKRAEIARALLAEPRLLMLDEPAGGIAHAEVDALAGIILRLRAELGLTILLVEHHMGLVSAVTDRVVVLVEGRKVAQGTAAQVRDTRPWSRRTWGSGTGCLSWPALSRATNAARCCTASTSPSRPGCGRVTRGQRGRQDHDASRDQRHGLAAGHHPVRRRGTSPGAPTRWRGSGSPMSRRGGERWAA